MMLDKIKNLLEMIKFKHTVFAMPFAFIGAFLAGRGMPTFWVFCWVVAAMVGARTCAMGFNRIADRKFDAANPRTANRALPSGDVTLKESWAMVIASGFLFFFSCFMLNNTALLISPFALSLTLFYSYTKRFTWLCHVVLGVALAFSPLGGWIAVAGTMSGYPWALSLGVLFWVAGFDCIYACLDADFDRDSGLHSMPSIFGRENSFKIAVVFHMIAFILFTLTGIVSDLNVFYYIGITVTGAALFYQHYIINPKDLSKIQMSFFSMNGLIALTLFMATWISLLTIG